MSGLAPHPSFREAARSLLEDEHVTAALDSATTRLREGREIAWSEAADVEELRERGHEIRMRTLGELEQHLGRFIANAEQHGAHVFVAETAADANAYIGRLCADRGAKLVAKSKSMVTEELGLNEALAEQGIEAVETDLGEYLMQLAGEQPMHIIAPAITKTLDDAARLLEVDGEADFDAVLSKARGRLRGVFQTADIGITGANFGVAETGSVCLVTNEGNGRLVSGLPPVHVAVMGIERLVPTLDDLAVLLSLLARSATGQRLSTYTTLITGPRRVAELDGPEELHIVVVDNGRSSLLAGKYREMLACIRCGACLNVCPVYRKAGGAAYSTVYSGPVGAVLVPLLSGLERATQLPHASSLCGACTAACPVKIPLHEMLVELRRDLVETHLCSRRERVAFVLWSLSWQTVAGYRLSTWLARILFPLARRTAIARVWVGSGRELPTLARERYRDRLRGARHE